MRLKMTFAEGEITLSLLSTKECLANGSNFPSECGLSVLPGEALRLTHYQRNMLARCNTGPYADICWLWDLAQTFLVSGALSADYRWRSDFLRFELLS
jgi:hypothetical protein